jgi:hypothetical protein
MPSLRSSLSRCSHRRIERHAAVPEPWLRFRSEDALLEVEGKFAAATADVSIMTQKALLFIDLLQFAGLERLQLGVPRLLNVRKNIGLDSAEIDCTLDQVPFQLHRNRFLC